MSHNKNENQPVTPGYEREQSNLSCINLLPKYEELYRSMSQRLNDTLRKYLQLENDYIGLREKLKKPLNTDTGLRFFLDEISKN
jgi:hypothetical protein